MGYIKRLDQPMKGMDDWDILQASAELMLEEASANFSGKKAYGGVSVRFVGKKFDADEKIQEFFPFGQSKVDQEKIIREFSNSLITKGAQYAAYANELSFTTPVDILENALVLLNAGASNLPEVNTPRGIFNQFFRLMIDQGRAQYPSFHNDLWRFLATKKIVKNESLLRGVPVAAIVSPDSKPTSPSLDSKLQEVLDIMEIGKKYAESELKEKLKIGQTTMKNRLEKLESSYLMKEKTRTSNNAEKNLWIRIK